MPLPPSQHPLALHNFHRNMVTQASLRSKLDDITSGVTASEVQSNKTTHSTSFADGTGVLDFVNEFRGVLRSVDRHIAVQNKIQPCIESDEEEGITQGWIDEIPCQFEAPPSYQEVCDEDDECPFSDEQLDEPVSTLSHHILYWARRRSDRIRDAARAKPVPAPIPLSNFRNPESPIRPSEHALGRRSRLFQSWTVDTEYDALESPNYQSTSGASTGSFTWSDDEDEELEEPAALLEYFVLCRKGGDASCEKEATYQSESEDEDSLDSIEEDEELGDVDDLLKYFESCKRT